MLKASRKLVGICSLCLTAIALWAAIGRTGPLGVTDFAAYWTASRQLLARGNPYAVGPVLAMERRLGFTGPLPLIMRNPPWALPFILPFGLLPYSTAQRLWLCVAFAAVMASVRLLWRLYAKPEAAPWAAWLATGLFLPVAAVLALGQIGPFILLGVAGFLACERAGRDGWAGSCAFLIAFKPHLAFLFWPAFVLWIVREQRWRVLPGFIVAFAAASAVALGFDARVFTDYRELWAQTRIVWAEMPTPGGLLCLAFGRQRSWLAFLPAIAAAIWFVYHWARKKRDWHWGAQMPLLLLVSTASSPYAWFFDQVIVLPAALRLTAAKNGHPAREWLWPTLAYLSINGLILGLLLNHQSTFWYAWTAPAWLVMYLWFLRF